MSQPANNTNIVNRNDDTNRSTKPTDTLRPHYYTTFQSYCSDAKADSSTSTPNKDLLPIPQKFKDEAEGLLNAIHGVLIENLNRVTQITNVIPDKFFEKNDNFQVQKYLIDRIMLRTMTDANIINWMPTLKKIYPIRTSGNGNCLLHAVLIAMVSIHDLNLNLRDRLAQFMDDNNDVLKNHWRTERLKSDKNYGISSEDSKLDDEWNELCNLVRYENSENGQTATQLQYLEAVHIFSTSNMLRRPIIVLSEDIIRNKNGEPISVNDIYGIYLPILSSASECVNEPIVLAYDHSHFCPLETNENRTEKTILNCLPLYLSINHTYDQKVLPIRFLGEDVSVERSDNLLHEYLRIQKVEHSFDSNSPPLSVLCAELGKKNLASRDNFFELYYKYIIDFFEIQKPKAIEEERRNERQREIENYASRHGSYDVNNTSVVIEDPISSSSSSRLTNTTNNNQSRNQNNYPYEQYVNDDTYNNRGYIPYDSPIHLENSRTQPQQSKRPPDYVKTTQRTLPGNYDPHGQYTQSYPKPNSDNISNMNNNGKMINNVQPDIREEENKFKRDRQQQNSIQIPVQVLKPTTRSNNTDLFIYEPKRDLTDSCALCQRLFYDEQSIRICPDCDKRIGYTSSRYESINRPSDNRPRSTNMYLPARNSSYTVVSPTSTTRLRRVVQCPYCKSPNLNSTSSSTDYFCSTCRKLIPTSELYY